MCKPYKPIRRLCSRHIQIKPIFRGLVWVGIACLLAVSGCGIKWWYDQIDRLLQYRIDHYFDVTDQQADFISRRLEEHLRWHRYEGLPVHIRFLSETRQKVADGVSREKIFWFFRQYRKQLRMIIERLSADSILFLTQLTDGQIDYFSDQLREANEKYEKRLKMTREERLAVRADSTIDFLEEWLGDLTKEQERKIRKMSLALPDRFESWYRRRLENQQSFVAALREKKEKGEIRKSLFRLLLPPEEDSHNSFTEPVVTMILSVDRMVLPRQRQHVMKKLQGWVESLQEISRDES